MIIRLIIFLVCTLAFINGCNSIISNFAGTHKLRNYKFGEIINQGIGDADFIQIDDGILSDQYIFIPGDRTFRKDLLIFPITTTSNQQMDSIKIIGWAKSFDPSCVQRKDCQLQFKGPIKGIISDVSRVRKNADQLQQKNLVISNDHTIFIELDRVPFPWYWNLIIMVVSAAIILFMESRRITNQQEASLNDR